MGVLDFIKGGFSSSAQRSRDADMDVYLLNSRNNLKLASEYVIKFLQETRGFDPAMRHRQLYAEEVIAKLNLIRGGVRGGLLFLDDKMQNELNTQNPIRNTDQLRAMINEWIRTLNANEENKYDVLKILNLEMWGEDRARRGFPVPRNKEMLFGYLNKALEHFSEARRNLDEYAVLDAVPGSN